MKRVLTPLALACLLAGPSSIHAAAYSGMVVFGDSLSDAGQRPESGALSNPVRYTNKIGPSYALGEAYGSTSPMLINDLLGLAPQTASTNIMRLLSGEADGNNWAVGGYRTDQVYNSITSVFDPATGIGGSQVRAGLTYADPLIRQRDGYLPYLQANGLSIDPDTLFYVNGGGNDFLQRLIVDEASARAAAGRLGDSVRALQAAGGRYFMVPLLVDVLNPYSSVIFSPTQEAQANAFNSELRAQLGSINAEIIPLNVPLLYREVLANPAAYGFDPTQNLLGTCFSSCGGGVNATYGVSSATPDPSKLLYADYVHPTTAMQQILAHQAFSILAAPWEISLLPQAADSALDNARGKLQQQWLGDWGRWQAVGQWRGFVDGGVSRADFDGDDTRAAGDGESKTLNLGGSYRLDENWRLGLALALDDQQLELGARDSEYGLRSYLASAFAQYEDGLLWGDLTLSAGYLDYHDLKRRFALGITTRTEQGDTDGQSLAIGGRLGVELAADQRLRLRPFISADYAHTEVNGYRESGASSTALSYDDQRLESKRMGLGLQGRFALAEDAELFGEIVREHEFEDDQQSVEMALNSVSGVNFELKGYEPDSDVTRATLGLRQQLDKDLAWQLGYSYQHSGDDDQHGISLGLVLDW